LQRQSKVTRILRQFTEERAEVNSRLGANPTPLPPTGEAIAAKPSLDCAHAAQVVERRVKPRIRQPFPTRVCGVDSEDRPFDLNVGLENISSRGIYLRIPRLLKSGDELSLVVRFSNGHHGATAALRASVLRVEPGLDGLNGIAMAIHRYEFI
jgi:hypothetical protein